MTERRGPSETECTGMLIGPPAPFALTLALALDEDDEDEDEDCAGSVAYAGAPHATGPNAPEAGAAPPAGLTPPLAAAPGLEAAGFAAECGNEREPRGVEAAYG